MATRNRYAEIMANYAQAQPYSFFGYPQSYTGGQSNYTGGYDVTPYTPYTAPANRYADIMAQPAAPMGGGGRGEREAPSAWSQMTPAERAAYYRENPTEGKIALGMQDLFGNATLLGNATKYFGGDGWYDSRLEKMGVNPTISLENQNTLAGTSFQNALNALNATGGFVSAAPSTQTSTLSFAPPTEAQYGAYLAQQQADAAGREYGTGAVPPNMTQNQFAAQYAAYGDRQQPAAAGREYGTGAVPPGVSANQFAANYAAYNNPNAVAVPSQDGGFVEGRTSPSSLVYGPNPSLTASIAAQAQAQADASAAQASREASAQASLAPGAGSGGGYGGGGDGAAGRGEPGGDRGGWGRGGGYAKGGHVSMMHLQGPNPMGPDDGYGALKDGEYVINDKAVKKYGIELMDAINSGKISKGKLRGLLEM